MCPSHHHSILVGDALIAEDIASSREIILNGTSKEQHAVQRYNSNSHNMKSHCECNNSNSSCKKRQYHKFNDNDSNENNDVNINVLPSQDTCDSLNSLVVGRADVARRHGEDNVSLSVSPSVSPSVSSSTINSCSGCGRLPTTTSPSPSDQEFNLDATIRRSMYRTKDSYSSTNTSSSNNSLNSTKSSVSAAVNNLDDSLTIISNNRDASIKLDEISQRSFSLSTSDNGVLDDLEIENPTNSAVAHIVEHEICDERKTKHTLAKKRHRASNHNERSDSQRYHTSSSSSSSESSCNTIHSHYSHKSDTQRDILSRTDVVSRQSGNRSPPKSATSYRQCDCVNDPHMDHSDMPEAALIPQRQPSECAHCSRYGAASSNQTPKPSAECSSCGSSNNRCCGCDKSIHPRECSTSSSIELGDDDDDVDDEEPRQSLSLNTSSSSASIPSSPPPLSVASQSSSITSIHSMSYQPQADTHMTQMMSTSKNQSKNQHIKAIL